MPRLGLRESSRKKFAKIWRVQERVGRPMWKRSQGRIKRLSMPSGNNPVPLNLFFEKIGDASVFSSFRCGIRALDDFIHEELQDYMDMDCKAFCVRSASGIVGLFCLDTHTLFLDDSVKEKMQDGLKPSPELEECPYWEVMNHFPSMEITYLAVDVRFQRKHIGSFIVEQIMDYVASLTDIQLDFVTVRAYNTKEYTAIPFYKKCGFTAAADRKENTNLFMYRVVRRK